MSELNEKLATAWEGFAKGDWQNEVNVRDFIQKNYTPYEGDESFLAGATEATTKLWDTVMEGVKQENRTHAPVDFDTALASTITSHDAGYIEKGLEKIVGLQTEAPLKRAIIPFGGIIPVPASRYAAAGDWRRSRRARRGRSGCTRELLHMGVRVNKRDLRPGDLVFFRTRAGMHVGFYDTDHNFLHASSSQGVIDRKSVV